ncbi:MAG TPA: hypothetical protein VHC00_11230 [Rhizobiaceae bacterium]|nr:hypothetical protein [Rhizobiaceae bacterium]
MSSEAVDHFCPGCGQPQKAFLRYPWHFCSACLGQAEDWQGRRLLFSNASITGGLTWSYRDASDEWRNDSLKVLCLIKGRPVLVMEARFGGVVAQPAIGNVGPLAKHFPLLDLTHPSSDEKKADHDSPPDLDRLPF